MTQEEKQLLSTDLCGRLPYEVICQNPNGMKFTLRELNPKQMTLYGEGCVHDFDGKTYYIGHIKPYLRPMSSMTKEELFKVQKILGSDVEIHDDFINILSSSVKSLSYLELLAVFDWLNAHHFDYRGLIKRDLALEALKGMYDK